jgi:hypothetical protein
MGMGRSRGRARSWLRHPMLTGVIVWAMAQRGLLLELEPPGQPERIHEAPEDR